MERRDQDFFLAEVLSASQWKTEKDDSQNFFFFFLLLLIIPLAGALYLLVCFCRRYHNRRLARGVRLWGPSESRDVEGFELSQVTRGDDGLKDRNCTRNGDGASNNEVFVDALSKVDEFDPIFDEANKLKGRERWRRRSILESAESSSRGADVDGGQEATVDGTDDLNNTGKQSAAGTYYVATTRVWVKNLEEAEVDCVDDGVDTDRTNDCNNEGSKTNIDGCEILSTLARGTSMTIEAACPPQNDVRELQRKAFHKRVESRNFEEILTTMSLPKSFSTAAQSDKSHAFLGNNREVAGGVKENDGNVAIMRNEKKDTCESSDNDGEDGGHDNGGDRVNT